MSELAIEGGSPVRTEPLPPWPSFTEDDAQLAADVVRSGKVNYWTGSHGRAFEEEYAARLGVPHAIAVANGTVSLELALKVIGVGAGDEVITTPRTFMASASCAVAVGARPVFADVDRDSGNITAESIERVMTPRTRAIIPVHLGGWPCEMDEITDLARSRGITVIEDCAQAHGAMYRGREVGTIGEFGSWSFCQDKILTTAGEGGLLTTRDEEHWRAAWAYKDHGKSYAAVFEREHPPGYRWVVESFGTNWRMSEIHAAVGRRWLARLDEMVARRRHNMGVLTDRLSGLSALRVPTPPAHVEHASYKLHVYLEPSALAEGWDRGRVRDAICAEGIPCRDGSCSEIYLEAAFPDGWRPSERLPVARELGETSLMFMVHPTLTDADMNDTADAIEKVLARAAR